MHCYDKFKQKCPKKSIQLSRSVHNGVKKNNEENGSFIHKTCHTYFFCKKINTSTKYVAKTNCYLYSSWILSSMLSRPLTFNLLMLYCVLILYFSHDRLKSCMSSIIIVSIQCQKCIPVLKCYRGVGVI